MILPVIKKLTSQLFKKRQIKTRLWVYEKINGVYCIISSREVEGLTHKEILEKERSWYEAMLPNKQLFLELETTERPLGVFVNEPASEASVCELKK